MTAACRVARSFPGVAIRRARRLWRAGLAAALLAATLAAGGGALGAANSAVLVTDTVLRQAGLAQRVEDGLTGSGVSLAGIFDAVPPNSEVQVVEEGAAFARAAGCDLLIALGGGSVLDTAKAMNLLLSKGGALLDFQGAGLLTRPLRPLIAIPTTAGTGSEVTIAAVILDEAQGLKLEFNSPYLMPDVAILDPELTVSLPPGLTASTGMDALTHAIETVVSTGTQPLSEPDPSLNRKSFNRQIEPSAEAVAATADPFILETLHDAGIYEPTATQIAEMPEAIAADVCRLTAVA